MEVTEVNVLLPDGRLGYSFKELAMAYGVCTRTIHNLVNAGQLTARYVGRRRIVPADAARKFLQRDHPLPRKMKKAKAQA